MQGVAAGLHSGAFHVGRAELLQWLNDSLQLSYTKVEQVANGAAFCQLCDMLWPGSVPMSKVNFDAKFEHESVKNFKIMQQVFDKQNVPRVIDAAKLVKGKVMDNLEMLQWMKHFVDSNRSDTSPYDAVGRRSGKAVGAAPARATSAAASSASAISAIAPTDASTTSASLSTSVAAAPAARSRAVASKENARPAAPVSQKVVQAEVSRVATQMASQHEAELLALKEQVAQLETACDALEKERDFYYGKLRDIEIYTQDHEADDSPIVKGVQAILYATDDAPVAEN